MMQWSNLTKFIFQHSPPQQCCSTWIPTVYHPDPQKKSSTADMTSSSVRYCFPAKCIIHAGEQKLVRWCHIMRIWRVIKQFKATITHSSHCNHRLVCRSINCPGETGLPSSSVFQAILKWLWYSFSKS